MLLIWINISNLFKHARTSKQLRATFKFQKIRKYKSKILISNRSETKNADIWTIHSSNNFPAKTGSMHKIQTAYLFPNSGSFRTEIPQTLQSSNEWEKNKRTQTKHTKQQQKRQAKKMPMEHKSLYNYCGPALCSYCPTTKSVSPVCTQPDTSITWCAHQHTHTDLHFLIIWHK